MNPDPSTNIWWQIGEHFGFPIVVCCALFFYIGKRLGENTSEVGRNTRATALVVLAMSFAPKAFHDQAREIYHESLNAARRRKEDLSTELHRKEE